MNSVTSSPTLSCLGSGRSPSSSIDVVAISGRAMKLSNAPAIQRVQRLSYLFKAISMFFGWHCFAAALWARLDARGPPIKGVFGIKSRFARLMVRSGNSTMRPLTMITGILFGSCAAITISLALVLIVFLLLGDEHPRLQHEFRPLVSSLLIFLGMTAISAASFYSLLIGHRARFVAQGLLWLGLLGTGWYYWP